MTALEHRRHVDDTEVVVAPTTTPDVTITNVRAVLDDAVIDDATVTIRAGVIEAVDEGRAHGHGVIDGGGLHCIPGLIDTHSDGFEKELRPRPNVELPEDFALASFEARVRSAAVTTVFHGIGFENRERYDRTVEQAERLCAAIARRRAHHDVRLDHRILYRLDVRDEVGLGALAEQLASRHRDLGTDDVPLVSAEDHTPGVGQYTDRGYFEQYIAGTKGLSADEARAYIDGLVDERDALIGNIESAFEWLSARARAGLIKLMGHDPISADEIDAAVDRMVTIAEFPTTLEAACRARERGLRTVSGAPNVVRGGSHSGNVSARELIEHGLCDGLASDYLPTTLLGAVGLLAHDGVCDLPSAIALVTSGPAGTVGLTDRGRLAPGLRGDVALVNFDRQVPVVHLVASACDVVGPSAAPIEQP
ncbi:MAG: alpha-D-ribose 1-methylphosphonate 5-triphosphate diphosphatase [Actinomycetota bacterium]